MAMTSAVVVFTSFLSVFLLPVYNLKKNQVYSNSAVSMKYLHNNVFSISQECWHIIGIMDIICICICIQLCTCGH